MMRMELREPTKEELAVIHSKLRRDHEKRVGPMIVAFHDRITAAQRVAFFDPCYTPAAMNNFVYRRVYEPDKGMFAGRGALTHFFCIMEAKSRVPCWVVRMKVGEEKWKDKQGRAHYRRLAKIRPAMEKVLVETAESMLEGVGGRTFTRMADDRLTFYVYRPFTAHERRLVFPVFLGTPGVTIGPVAGIETA